jgi:hypothetical protein
MTKSILLAGILGGIALFAWESVSHMLTPLGDAGIQGLSNEPPVLAALKENIKAPGFYFFPAPEIKPGMTKEQQQQAMQVAMDQYRTGPAGILIFHPDGAESLSARQFLVQFGADVVVMLLAAFLLASATGLKSYAARLGFVTLMGLIPTLRSELPYWNWYGFPCVYVTAQFTVHLVGFLVGGLVLARFIRPVPE